MTAIDHTAPVLHLPTGLPGAGKATLARELAAAGAAHVELDAIRRRVWPSCPRSWDPYSGDGLAVQAAFEAAVLEQLAAGRDVVADRTWLNPEGLRRLRALAPGVRVVTHDLRHVPLKVCIARDAARPVADRVGADGIRDLWRRWLAPVSHVDARPTPEGPSAPHSPP